MNKTKLFTGIFMSSMLSASFVSADMYSGPALLIIPIIAWLFFAGFIVGAVFLIRWIIKKTNKQK